MSAKTSPARIRAFFAALTATGNQTLAAERAKVSRAWVSLHRASDPVFRARMEEAIAAARIRLEEAAAVRPVAGWRAQAGEELTVRGSRGRRMQVARARLRQWTPRIEDRFLGALAATCNVKLACAAVGLSAASAFGHRKRWPAFAQRWTTAVQAGYDRIRGALLEGGLGAAGNRDDDFPLDGPIPPMTADQALQLLRLHQAEARGVGPRVGRMAKRPAPGEVTAALIRILDDQARVAALREARAARRASRRAGVAR